MAISVAESAAPPTQVRYRLRHYSDTHPFRDGLCRHPWFGLRFRINSVNPAGKLFGDRDRVHQRSKRAIPVHHTKHHSDALADRHARPQFARRTSGGTLRSSVTLHASDYAAAGTASQYVAPLSASCITQFWDPKFYNWLSFQNNCGQAIHFSFIATNPIGLPKPRLGTPSNNYWTMNGPRNGLCRRPAEAST